MQMVAPGEKVKATLNRIGLLEAARLVLRKLRAAQRQRYYSLLIEQYRSPFAKPRESYLPYERRERDASEKSAQERYESDQKAILGCALDLLLLDGLDEENGLDGALAARYTHKTDDSLARHYSACITAMFAALAQPCDAHPRSLARRIKEITRSFERPLRGHRSDVAEDRCGKKRFDDDRKALVRAILDRVIDVGLAPRFYDYDYIDDIVGIVGARYCSDNGCDVNASSSILDALAVLIATDAVLDWHALPSELRKLMGSVHAYVPSRGDVTKHVWTVIPDLAEEFLALKAERNEERFLQINREYSKRQAFGQGLWDNRELSLLRGYERDHHLLLRTLIALIQDGHVSKDDEVLVIGPRHIDEVVFFRKSLGLRKTIGLDLFEFGNNQILAGDMHRMSFESDRFKLVYCAGTLSYSYNVRRVIDEIVRVSKRPGFVLLVDAAGRKTGPDALGRSDIVSVETLIGLFYRYSFHVLAKDAGRSLAPELYENEPCLALRLENAAKARLDFPTGTDLTRYSQRPLK